jgi:hypothetical protein
MALLTVLTFLAVAQAMDLNYNMMSWIRDTHIPYPNHDIHLDVIMKFL